LRHEADRDEPAQRCTPVVPHAVDVAVVAVATISGEPAVVVPAIVSPVIISVAVVMVAGVAVVVVAGIAVVIAAGVAVVVVAGVTVVMVAGIAVVIAAGVTVVMVAGIAVVIAAGVAVVMVAGVTVVGVGRARGRAAPRLGVGRVSEQAGESQSRSSQNEAVHVSPFAVKQRCVVVVAFGFWPITLMALTDLEKEKSMQRAKPAAAIWALFSKPYMNGVYGKC
jgi:hypothetical protein